MKLICLFKYDINYTGNEGDLLLEAMEDRLILDLPVYEEGDLERVLSCHRPGEVDENTPPLSEIYFQPETGQHELASLAEKMCWTIEPPTYEYRFHPLKSGHYPNRVSL